MCRFPPVGAPSSVNHQTISEVLTLAPLSSTELNVLSSAPSRLSVRLPHPRSLALVVGMIVLGWAYWPNLQNLYTIWDNEPNYSHGKLVIPIALAIFIQRLSDSKASLAIGRGPWWSWAVLAAILAGRAFAYERGSQWLETATIVPAVAAVMLTLGGWPLLGRGWPAAAFLVFMLNLPPAVNNFVAMPLQKIATMGSVFVMQLTGLWVISEGNIIVLSTPFPPPNDHKLLEVALACNGLSMLMTLAATVTATIMLIPLENWKRIVVLASAIPIALLSNIIRIVVTGWCYYYIEGEEAKKLVHDLSGWLMMPLALVLVGLEVLILSWLTSDGGEDEEADARPIDPILARLGGNKAKVKFPADEL
jgi:exosortase